MVQMKPVTSSNIQAVGHDPEKNELHVMFKGGGHYVYSGVDEGAHDDLVNAGSVGNHFHSNIKDQYTARKV